jgi:hypothetical protein
MNYISKGMGVKASTEDILYVTRCGGDFQLTGLQADLWLNGRFGFSELREDNRLAISALNQLKRKELVELDDSEEAGEYRALTQCVLTPAKNKSGGLMLSADEKWTLKWLIEAGLRLSMAELVCLREHGVNTEPELLGDKNRQALTEVIYTQENIFDNILETQMEHAAARDAVVRTVLSLLKKKRIILL